MAIPASYDDSPSHASRAQRVAKVAPVWVASPSIALKFLLCLARRSNRNAVYRRRRRAPAARREERTPDAGYASCAVAAQSVRHPPLPRRLSWSPRYERSPAERRAARERRVRWWADGLHTAAT